MAERYPLPIDIEHITVSSQYFQLQAALAYIAYLSREGSEITLEKILALLKELKYFFEDVDSDAEKKEKEEEKERKKLLDEISRNLKIYRQVAENFKAQRAAIQNLIEEAAIQVTPLSLEDREEYTEQLEERLQKGI